MDDLPSQFIALTAVSFAGAFAKGLVGFGAPLIMVPLFGLWMPMTVAVPLGMLLALISTLPMFPMVGRAIRLRRDLPPATSFMLGILVGVQLLLVLPEATLRLLLGAVLLAFVIYVFLRPAAPREPPPWTAREILILASFGGIQGVLAGAVGGGAIPLIPYLALRYPPAQMRAMLVVVFTLGTSAQTLGYAAVGLIGLDVLTMAALSLPGMFVGLYAGNAIHHRVNPAFFGRVIAALLVLPALRMLGVW